MQFTLNTKVYDFAGFNREGLSVYKNTASGVPSGFSYLTAYTKTGMSMGGKGQKPVVVRYNLSIPHVATEASACACPGTLIDTDYVRIEVQAAATTDAAGRTDLYNRLKDLVLSAGFKASIENLTQPG